MYNGDLNKVMEKGLIMGHEAIGIVEEVGSQVKNLSVGDRVIILPVIACGECFYCKKKEYSLCDKTNPSKELEGMYGHRLSGIFGYSLITGGYPGDQAEYCRVPNADLTCVKAPHDIDPKKLVGLADVTPTAWHGNELAEVGEGDVVGVWGCGAVGLSIQRLAKLRGASKVYAIDKDEHRLDIAKSYGMIPVNVNLHSDPADYILSVEPHGLDRGIEASGFRSTNSTVHASMRALGVEGDSSDTVAAAIKATRKGGNVALIGDFFYSTNNFPIGMMMEKAITVRGGQLYAQKVSLSRSIETMKHTDHEYSISPFFWTWLSRVNTIPHSCLPTKVQYLLAERILDMRLTRVDDFENVSKNYDAFFSHKTPGGLKVCMAAAFGRAQSRR